MTPTRFASNSMRFLFILVGLSFLCGCSKKMLSGVYNGDYTENEIECKETYDIRTDGTVAYKGNFISQHLGVWAKEGPGVYTIDGDKVNVGVALDGYTNQEIFKMEGDDLILIANAEGGKIDISKIDGIQPRFIKMK